MPLGSQFRLRLRRRIEKLWGTIFSFKKHTKDGRCFWAEYFFEVFLRLLLKPKSRKNISSKVGKISNYLPVEGLNSKVHPGLVPNHTVYSVLPRLPSRRGKHPWHVCRYSQTGPYWSTPSCPWLNISAEIVQKFKNSKWLVNICKYFHLRLFSKQLV